MFHHKREARKELNKAKEQRALSSHLLHKARTEIIEPLRKIDRENNFSEMVEQLLYGSGIDGT